MNTSNYNISLYKCYQAVSLPEISGLHAVIYEDSYIRIAVIYEGYLYMFLMNTYISLDSSVQLGFGRPITPKPEQNGFDITQDILMSMFWKKVCICV